VLDLLKSALSWMGKMCHNAASYLQSSRFDPVFAVRFLDRYLAWARKILTPDLFEKTSAFFVKLGHIMIVAVSVLSLFFWFFAAIKASKGSYLLYALCYSAGFLALQYTAHKFIDAGKALVHASPSRMASGAFLDCLALLSTVTGVLVFVTSLTYDQWNYVWIAIGIWAVCDLISWVALNPPMTNTAISTEATAGEEAIGIVSFFVKTFMRIIPMAYGLGLTIGFFSSLSGTFALLKKGGLEFEGQTALNATALYACLPLLSYALFVLYHLTIDILRAILVIPLKLDQLRGRKQKDEE